jgi:hypothetical protein
MNNCHLAAIFAEDYRVRQGCAHLRRIITARECSVNRFFLPKSARKRWSGDVPWLSRAPDARRELFSRDYGGRGSDFCRQRARSRASTLEGRAVGAHPDKIRKSSLTTFVQRNCEQQFGVRSAEGGGPSGQGKDGPDPLHARESSLAASQSRLLKTA